ncbi:MAG: hypothetical protein WDW38_009158 [Sanguina aurantia]
MVYAQGITSTHFPPGSPIVVLDVLVEVINELLARGDRDSGYSGPYAFLNAPSVTHLLKAIPCMAPEPHCCTLTCLSVVLCEHLEKPQACGAPALSTCDGHDNRDAAGLPLHMQPLLSPQSLDADVLLLHALSKRVESNAYQTALNLQVQYYILQAPRM